MGRRTPKGGWGWGGWRPGAGRKPKGDVAGVRHAARSPVPARCPVHVRLRLRADLPSLRGRAVREALRGALEEGSGRLGCRVVLGSLAPGELQLLVEARGRAALGRGLQGLLVRVAKRLNRHWEREGSVFADRYAARVLRTPHEVRRGLAAVREGRPLEDGRAANGRVGRGRGRGRAPEVVFEAPGRTGLLRRATRRRS